MCIYKKSTLAKMADTKPVVTKPFWREPAGDDRRDRTGKKPTSPPLVELSPERV